MDSSRNVDARTRGGVALSKTLPVLAALSVALPGVARADEGACEVVPPFQPSFEPELEWTWSGSTVMPTHNQVMMTPVVADVSGDGVPDVLFNSFQGSQYSFDGVLRAVSGADGSELWTVTDPAHQVRGAASVTVGDIDGDAQLEVCTIPDNGVGFICFEHDGSFKFRSTAGANSWGAVSFADLDNDGDVEILNGNVVATHTGALVWAGIDGTGGHSGTGPISFAVDLDQDDGGKLEVVNGRSVYEHDGTLKWSAATPHGLAGVGNFDADPQGEVINVANGVVYLIDHTGAVLASRALPGGGAGGAPNIADFDNDGQPEVGVAGANYYVVFETDLTVKWQSQVQDFSSHRTGSSTFDFEGDGRAEVVYADERFLRIYDGATGTIRFQVASASGTTYENPVIVDVDGDGNAEIVQATNNYSYSPGPRGIRVWRDANDGWVNTRRIWNQHAYSVTNVEDDGAIPQFQATNWLTPGLNTFRSNTQGDGVASPFAAPDLTAVDLVAECVEDSYEVRITVRVRNEGDAPVSAGLPVAFYDGDPEGGGALLGVETVSAVIPEGGEAFVTLSLDPSPGGETTVYAVADDDGTGTGRELECDETNNATHALLDLTCVPNEPPVAVCQDVTVAADEMCQACASVDGGSYDPDGEPWSIDEAPMCEDEPFELGETDVTLTITDPEGESDTCTAVVTVVDLTPPEVAVAEPLLLWPPNHKYVTYTLSDCAAVVFDNCEGEDELDIDAVGRIVSMSSDEPEEVNGNGDGKTYDDMVIVDDSTFKVRSERQGGGNGRVYSVTFEVTDEAGNATTATCQLAVPHDQSGTAPVDDGAAAGYTIP